MKATFGLNNSILIIASPSEWREIAAKANELFSRIDDLPGGADLTIAKVEAGRYLQQEVKLVVDQIIVSQKDSSLPTFFIETDMKNDWGQHYGIQRHLIVDKNGLPVQTRSEALKHLGDRDESRLIDVSDEFENSFGNSNDLWKQECYGPNLHKGEFINDRFEIVNMYGNRRSDLALAK